MLYGLRSGRTSLQRKSYLGIQVTYDSSCSFSFHKHEWSIDRLPCLGTAIPISRRTSEQQRYLGQSYNHGVAILHLHATFDTRHSSSTATEAFSTSITMFSSHSHSHSSAGAVISFIGPGPDRHITVINSSGQEVARFIADGSKKRFTISRLTAPGAPPVPICTASKSSWSDTTELRVHGAELKLEWSSSLGQDATVNAAGPLGKLKWSEDSFGGSKYKLVDSSKTVIGRASIKDGRFDVLVPGNEQTYDVLLSSWIAYLLHHKSSALSSEDHGKDDGKETKDALAAIKVINALSGFGS
nr:hypothetical protein CFP56_11584 [Quercus suber]